VPIIARDIQRQSEQGDQVSAGAEPKVCLHEISIVRHKQNIFFLGNSVAQAYLRINLGNIDRINLGNTDCINLCNIDRINRIDLKQNKGLKISERPLNSLM
jgi:hypothetical protein